MYDLWGVEERIPFRVHFENEAVYVKLEFYYVHSQQHFPLCALPTLCFSWEYLGEANYKSIKYNL